MAIYPGAVIGAMDFVQACLRYKLDIFVQACLRYKLDIFVQACLP
jgi:hypothetical protein